MASIDKKVIKGGVPKPCGQKKCKETINTPFESTPLTCYKCTSDVQYCSAMCMRRDWHSTHQFVCLNNVDSPTPYRDKTNRTPGGPKPTKKKHKALTALELKHLENETPFLKIGKLLTTENIRDEKVLAGIQLTDLKFDAQPIGKGSYGVVYLATHNSGI